MRLYLSSYLWGNNPELLFDMVDGPKHVGLVTNSADQFPETGILERMQADVEYLKTRNFTAERLDLRNYFASSKGLPQKLETFGLIWVRGANVFVLRRAMRQSGFDQMLLDKLKADEIVYGGYSAGACVMGNDLRGLDLVDDATIAPAGYDAATIWEGLGVLPYAIAPHYKSDHPESGLIDESVAFFRDHHVPYTALRDGEAILVDGNREEIVGS